ncbi:MAG TPA: M1 family metallopeptidase [Gemmatimonadales bacterium]|nr:M1 family metallopeptidase [Gemmatimonadales bacterium]
MRQTLPALLAALALAPLPAQQPGGQHPRPRPYPVFESAAFQRAVDRGTRTRTGHPGPRYWQQWAEYRLEAELDAEAHRLIGRGTVRYSNRSPDTLRTIFFHLYQNLFAPEAIRNEPVPLTTGMELRHVAVGGETLARRDPADPAPGYTIDATILRIRPRAPLPPGGAVALAFEWAFTVPQDGAPRMGRDSAVYYLAYWYPQLAVYDDLGGWQLDPYLGNAEFYMGYADYDVAITVPEGWLVAATGTLANPDEVLSPLVRERLALSRTVDTVVPVVRADERGAGPGHATPRGRGGTLTWRFRAANVRDFAWGASRHWVWDATRASAGAAAAGSQATPSIHAFYRPTAKTWDRAAHYARHSVEFLSRLLWPYPYPHMTAVDGIASCGGMEYPMMTCIGGERDTLSLYGVMVHEIAHMWFPMQVGSDEKRYSWLDEGLTRFNQAEGMRDFFAGYDRLRQSRQGYLAAVRGGWEVELMRHGDLYPYGTPAFAVASYEKMALNLAMLRALLGEELFSRAYREYGRRWINRHPSPYDFWNSFEDVTGRDLDWFWRTWWFETWTLDQAIAAVRPAGDSLEIVIEDRGLAPMPVRLAVTRADASIQWLELPVETWLQGARLQVVRLAARPEVIRLEIDPAGAFPDVDRANQVWTRDAPAR